MGIFERRKWLTAYAPLLLWTAVILGLGGGSASMSETSRFIGPLLELLFPSAGSDTLYIYHAIIRKLAHVFEYGVLGLLAARVFNFARYRFVLSIVFVALVAGVDEWNQSFNPTRTSTIWDVVIDIAAGALGISVVIFFARRTSQTEQSTD